VQSRPSAVQNDPLANLTFRGEIPIVAALAYVPPPRFRALALFGRRPPERVVGIVGAGVRKPAQEQTSTAMQQRAGLFPITWSGIDDMAS
jgi:hypothetical protein